MLISDLFNVRYLTGFTGSNAALLVRVESETPVLATDGRYRTQAAQQAPDAEVVIERACGPHLAARAAEDGARRVGFESHVVTVDAFATLRKAAGDGVDAVRAAGDFVKIDFGALVCGYHSDMTRTFVLAPVAQWQLDIYQLVATAQQAGRDALAPGVTLKDVDGASRRVIADAGYADNFS